MPSADLGNFGKLALRLGTPLGSIERTFSDFPVSLLAGNRKCGSPRMSLKSRDDRR